MEMEQDLTVRDQVQAEVVWDSALQAAAGGATTAEPMEMAGTASVQHAVRLFRISGESPVRS